MSIVQLYLDGVINGACDRGYGTSHCHILENWTTFTDLGVGIQLVRYYVSALGVRSLGTEHRPFDTSGKKRGSVNFNPF